MKEYDLIVIGAGIAGMTAAISAFDNGIKNILVIEKENYNGGLVAQCIHNGFGKEFIGKEVTGPEFIYYLENELEYRNINILLESTVLDVDNNKVVTYVNSQDGVRKIKCKSIVFATGLKERYSTDLMLVTKKLIGICTLGEVHRMINFDGYLPGKDSVILVKNKWGFILARRILIEGGSIKAIILEKELKDVMTDEIKSIMSGFKFDIIEKANIVEISGKDRVDTVEVEISGENDTKIKQSIKCDSLILTVNYESNDELLQKIFNHDNKESIDKEGFFICGNIQHRDEPCCVNEKLGLNCGNQVANYINKIHLDKMF